MIKVLLSDDNNNLFEDFKDIAHKMDIDLTCVNNWEDARAILDQSWNDYAGLILDGKGRINDSSKTGDAVHLTIATGWLKEQRSNGRLIPTVLYTAFLDNESGNIDEFFDVKDSILIETFNKNSPVEKVFSKLIEVYRNLPETRVRHQYEDIFKLFDNKRLHKEAEFTMVDILLGLSDRSIDKVLYNKVREIVEDMLIMANSIDQSFFPSKLLNAEQNNRPNLGFSEFYLSGRDVKNAGMIMIQRIQPIMPEYISRIYGSVLSCCQIFSHKAPQKIYHFAYKSVVFGLLEILLWYRDYVAFKYKI